uniref:Uncharacterized protein n=1 Tax=Triticum urartu TaxID=4572 RepID=A0A8R7V555_TRIUA
MEHGAVFQPNTHHTPFQLVSQEGDHPPCCVVQGTTKHQSSDAHNEHATAKQHH